MQPVWSRVRHVRPRNAQFLRRISTATETIRSNPFHSGTLLYSSALAAAAAADAQVKLKAKSEWEEEVEAKKEEVLLAQRAVQDKAQNYLMSRLGINFEKDFDIDIEEIFQELENISQTEAPEITEQIRRRQEEAELKRLLNYAPYLQARRAHDIPTTIPFKISSLPPQSPWAGRQTRQVARNKAWVPKKIFRAELSAMRFVVELLLRAQFYDQEDENEELPYYVKSYAKLPKARLEKILGMIEKENIRTDGLSQLIKPMHPDFGVLEPYYDPASTQRTMLVQELNRRLFKILSEWHDTGKSELTIHYVISICETILRSPVHPDIQTCNILLTMFGAKNQDDLVDLVWDFIYDVSLRPNEITLVQMLRSYSRRSSGPLFLQLVSQMRGRSGGLMLASPDLTRDITEQTGGRVFPLYQWETMEDATYLVQAVTPSPIVFLEVIRGLLKFVGLESTMTICQDLTQYGWGMSYVCIHTLLRKCAIDSAWETGVEVWKQTEQLLTQGHPIPADMYALMLAFCHLLEDKVLFKKLFHQCLRNVGMEPNILVRKVRQELCQIRYHQSKDKPRLYGEQ